MTQNDILEMARSAGLTDGIELQHEIDAVTRFAELVAAAERDACAQIVERNAATCDSNTALRDILMSNAAAIRARGDA